MKNKKTIIIISILITILIVFLIIFYKNPAKKSQIGNNSSSQEIVDYILNISSYEAEIEVEVISNKNSNKYKLKQQYINPNISTQEILEPENLTGIKIIKKDKELKLENSKLNLTKIFENYEYMTDNCLDLNSFIQEYKAIEKSDYEEKENEIVMKIENTDSRYQKYKNLYIDRKSGNPTKMEIKDDSKKTLIYILYKEVELNNLNENILAFNKIYNNNFGILSPSQNANYRLN